MEKVFAAPPRGSTRPDHPWYHPESHRLNVRLDGQPAKWEYCGLYVHTYDAVAGWIEGYPRTPDGLSDRTRTVRRTGVVTVEMPD